MAEYEKNRKNYERAKIELERALRQIPSYLPESEQIRRREIETAQLQQAFPTFASTPTPAPAPIRPVQQQKQQGGLALFRNIPYLTGESTTPYVKLYDSSIDGELRDILFVNGHTTENLNFDLILSRLDIEVLRDHPNAPRNKTITDGRDSVFLARNMLLAQAGTAPSNPKQLSLSEIVGTRQILSSGAQKPFYIYVYKTNSSNSGQLDVTVMK